MSLVLMVFYVVFCCCCCCCDIGSFFSYLWFDGRRRLELFPSTGLDIVGKQWLGAFVLLHGPKVRVDFGASFVPPSCGLIVGVNNDHNSFIHLMYIIIRWWSVVSVPLAYKGVCLCSCVLSFNLHLHTKLQLYRVLNSIYCLHFD